MNRMAIKRLTASDLTFFKWHFEHHNAGNQKAINLNRSVFIDEMFSALPAVAQSHGGRVPLDLNIYGPGLHGCLNLQRKIVKTKAYKNWRLNGEFIADPTDTPDRFHSLTDGDLVVFSFLGDIHPVSAAALFVCRDLPVDGRLHERLAALIAERQMCRISSTQFQEAVDAALLPPEHPAFELLLDSALEDASQNGFEGMRQLSRRRSGRTVSKPELEQARKRAGAIGDTGEELINAFLEQERAAGRLNTIAWTSMDNAVSPYDFEIVSGTEKTLVEVKATSGEFDRPMHISYAELRRMAEGPEPYDIYRVYAVTDSQGKMRIARNVQQFAAGVLAACAAMPQGTTVDSISVSPSVLDFSAEELPLVLPADET